MFNKSDDKGYRQVIEGISLKTLVYGEKTLMAEFRLSKGADLPMHHHPHEQTGYVVSGRLRMTVGEGIFEAAAGDSWCIAADVEHGAAVLEDTVAVEVFSPVREDYLPDKG